MLLAPSGHRRIGRETISWGKIRRARKFGTARSTRLRMRDFWLRLRLYRRRSDSSFSGEQPSRCRQTLINRRRSVPRLRASAGLYRRFSNLQGVGINLRRQASMIPQQNKILRYGRLKICATFSFERSKDEGCCLVLLRVSVFEIRSVFAFRISGFTGGWGLGLGAFQSGNRSG